MSFVAFLFQNVKFHATCNAFAFMFKYKCVLLQRTPIWFVWSIFESNILLFCSQPHVITCIMYFVGVQI